MLLWGVTLNFEYFRSFLKILKFCEILGVKSFDNSRGNLSALSDNNWFHFTW